MSVSAAFWLKRAVGITSSFLVFSLALGCGDTTRAFVDDTAHDAALDTSAPGIDVSVEPDAVTVVDVAADTDSGRDAGGDATNGQDTGVADARDARDASDGAPDAIDDGVGDGTLDVTDAVVADTVVADTVVDIGQDVELDTGADVANQPPTIVATIPNDSATAVSVTTTISVDFSKAMNSSTVTVALQPPVALGAAIWNTDYTSIAFAPPTALAAMTSFTLTVTGSDNAGRALIGQTTFTFTTGAGADLTPPAIRATVPLNNATDVPAGTNIIVTFTEPMDVGSVVVTSVPDITLGMPTFSAQNDQVTFTPTVALLPYTEYTITVAGQDPAKNALTAPTIFKFTTQKPPDTTPPTVVAVQPPNGATAVPSNSSIVITFSEPMNVMATTGGLSLSPPVTCIGGWSWNQTSTTTSCIPASPLAFSTLYTVSVAATASDSSGNAMGSGFASSFTTGLMPDTTPPTIVSVTPLNGAAGVARNTKIVVNFSEAMDISAQLAMSVTSPMGTGSYTWGNGNTQLVYTPAAQFAYGTTVTWQVTNGAKDASGNAKTTTDIYSFNVIKSTTVNLPCIATLDGYAWGTSIQAGNGSIIPGETSSGVTYRGFAAFSMSTLPSTLTTITSAAIYLQQYDVAGTPYGTRLGNVLWQHVDYGATLENPDYSVGKLAHTNNEGTLSTSATISWKSSVVTASAQNDFANRVARGNRSEFLIRFTKDTAAPAAVAAEWAYFNSCETVVTTDRPYLRVTYEYP